MNNKESNKHTPPLATKNIAFSLFVLSYTYTYTKERKISRSLWGVKSSYSSAVYTSTFTSDGLHRCRSWLNLSFSFFSQRDVYIYTTAAIYLRAVIKLLLLLLLLHRTTFEMEKRRTYLLLLPMLLLVLGQVKFFFYFHAVLNLL